MLFYSIAHYFDVNDQRSTEKFNHILNHIVSFKSIDGINNEFIITSFIDSPRGDKRYIEIKRKLEEFCKIHIPNHKFHVIIEYNWGGTIAALWLSYKYVKTLNKMETVYIAHFEEDFGPKSSNWYEDSLKLLTPDIYYVGESNIGRLKKACKVTGQNDDGRLISQRGCTRLAMPEIWTDGGFYFSTMNKLNIMEIKIGIFHKGNQHTKYDNSEDGISLGEVGFPTLLHHAGLNFTCLHRNTYFNDEWCGSRQ